MIAEDILVLGVGETARRVAVRLLTRALGQVIRPDDAVVRLHNELPAFEPGFYGGDEPSNEEEPEDDGEVETRVSTSLPAWQIELDGRTFLVYAADRDEAMAKLVQGQCWMKVDGLAALHPISRLKAIEPMNIQPATPGEKAKLVADNAPAREVRK